MNTQDKRLVPELISLYQQLYELTNPLCKKCRVPQSCCSGEYCKMAADLAKEEYGIELKPVDEQAKLPFMSLHGCVVPAFLRPLCTRHHCSINGLGFFPTNPEANDKYFKLIEKINHIEYEQHLTRQDTRS